MKPQIRILTYSILFFLYLISTPIILTIGQKLKTEAFVTLGCGFAIFNLVYAFVVLKWTTLLNIVYAIAIAVLSIYLALKFANLHLFSNYDTYDIKTSILANAVFSIIFWEIVYQLKLRFKKS